MNNSLHLINWTPDKVGRIWDFYGSNPAYENAYFARHSGHRILAETDKLIRITGDLLDVGCGPGHLLEHIKKIPSWSSYTGIDTSEKSLQQLKVKGQDDQRSIQGVLVQQSNQIPDNSVDRIFCLEVMEHCDEPTLGEIFSMMRRVIRPSGYIIVTTPNDENLNKSMQICPECGCIYHKWQHVRSWICKDLSDFIQSCGFNVHTVYSCHFGRDDLGRGKIDSLAAYYRRRGKWREAFLHLPQIFLLATPFK